MAASGLLLWLLGFFYLAFHDVTMLRSVQGSRSLPISPIASNDFRRRETKDAVGFDSFPRTVQTSDLGNIEPTKVKDDGRVYHFAAVNSRFSEYYGAKARFSVHKLGSEVLANASTSAQIWLYNGDIHGPIGQVNAIQAGWHVEPGSYGDYKTHFFTYWTTDYYQKTGCLNLLCPGFDVHIGSPIFPGDTLHKFSHSERSQVFITLTIYKDIPSGDWCLNYEDDFGLAGFVGCWSKSLFTRLADNANRVSYGGEVWFPVGAHGPPMGSGHFSSDPDGKAASFTNLQVMDKDRRFVNFTYDSPDVDASNCYDVTFDPNIDGPKGSNFLYGGPGGCITE